MIALLWLIAAVQAVAAGVVLVRLGRGRDRPAPLDGSAPPRVGAVTVVIPARDEERRIRPLLAALERCDATVLEILVVDDRSTDATAAVVTEHAARDPRIRLIAGAEPPDGWVGKQHALQQGLAEARAPWTLCLDADAVPAAELPAALLAAADERRYDALTAGPRFAVDTAGEAILHPALLATLVYRFGPPTAAPVSSTRTMANGQCLLVPTERFRAAGGWAPVAANMTEDVALARHLVATGWRLGLVDAPRLLTVDMHASTREAWREWGRSLALPGVASGREQAGDVLVLALTMALPLPMVVACVWSGAWFAAVPSLVLLVVRVLFHIALRPTYAHAGAAYWLAPLADGVAVARVAWSAIRPNRRWRGRAYARSG